MEAGDDHHEDLGYLDRYRGNYEYEYATESRSDRRTIGGQSAARNDVFPLV